MAPHLSTSRPSAVRHPLARFVVLVLAWFLLLIGGFNLAGLQHLILLGAAWAFGYQIRADAPR